MLYLHKFICESQRTQIYLVSITFSPITLRTYERYVYASVTLCRESGKRKGLNRCLPSRRADCRRKCIVVSIDCILTLASARSRLIRDLNNIRVTTRGQQRKKVKGHSALPIDERTGGAKKGFAGERRRAACGKRKTGGGELLKSFVVSVRFSMKLDRPRATFSFPGSFSMTPTREMQSRIRRYCKKKEGFVHCRSFYYTYTQ